MIHTSVSGLALGQTTHVLQQAPRHVIPARARPVIPAKAGIQHEPRQDFRRVQADWIPACAGMTMIHASVSGLTLGQTTHVLQQAPRHAIPARARPVIPARARLVIPAKAGIQHEPRQDFRRVQEDWIPACAGMKMIQTSVGGWEAQAQFPYSWACPP